jgi:hypothetical protein
MKKIVIACACVLFAATAIQAQNFEPAPNEFQTKMEKYIGRYGTSERVYLNDTKKKTFDAKGGQIYLIAFVYNANSQHKRRMMVYEIGPNGEKTNPKYPDYSKGFRDSQGWQMFHVRLDTEGDNNTITKYKIDADTEATVYIYRVIKGVK